jgi:hypothetical protein
LPPASPPTNDAAEPDDLALGFVSGSGQLKTTAFWMTPFRQQWLTVTHYQWPLSFLVGEIHTEHHSPSWTIRDRRGWKQGTPSSKNLAWLVRMLG